MPVRVLVVDDSALVRSLLKDIIQGDPELHLVGCAPDAFVARDLIKQHAPDVITLDVEMPRMDGLTFLDKLMKGRPTPVLMISSLTEKGSEATLRALELGAIDFIAKPRLGIAEGMQAYTEEIRAKLKTAARARLLRPRGDAAPAPCSNIVPLLSTEKIIAIGASTGGTEAIKEVLLGLPPNCPGAVVTLHMPPGFTRSYAERLDRQTRLFVREARDGDRILPGHVLIAPGDYHLEVQRSGANYIVRLQHDAPVNGHRPAVDVMFNSLARCAGRNLLAALLTGMGKDGARGLQAIRQAGGHTIAQDEASCVVYGMPREAVELGAAREVLPLDRIAAALLQQARQSGSGNRV
ncbi:chemotaxis response regulator protein-glutamate methylesterase [Pseudomonas sp. ZM23]|uniref:Protein-glutamate methylesterase/protein-glutamine glutaminase n=1 Tax=Pseudomonas triclosanedens TaxID=2961893 RepID=A0ABY6ZXW6_9PSED|nr:chemotaxis response regulator protein-glutamate methylesterase [Pseudomonas triclosanedens]MCP8462629.1 chemotaxis response regulator protein-glutamate methylesterase [Pseudomonas triclosanedens]MCP8468248.1 chemotaxis response regulator protein-glutamate methylesterase [Pseudomonas triclosanedens]MCP8475007.1 chemotaxis response regulator protein-glutamate methylesterase [Pseudomonas triclosanedens]WAI49819.1 chemotaxis response regulator protein-glutamate methylesterase [Pseudomonas triclo